MKQDRSESAAEQLRKTVYLMCHGAVTAVGSWWSVRSPQVRRPLLQYALCTPSTTTKTSCLKLCYLHDSCRLLTVRNLRDMQLDMRLQIKAIKELIKAANKKRRTQSPRTPYIHGATSTSPPQLPPLSAAYSTSSSGGPHHSR